MAPSKHPENEMPEAHQDSRSSEHGQPEEDLETLEFELKQMAHKLVEYRTTLPDQLKTTLLSVLAAQRPLVPEVSDAPNPGASEQTISRGESSFALEDPEAAMKAKLLKEKISSNCSAMPIVLKRMKDCIVKIEKLDSYNAFIHPAFKRTRTR